MAEGSGAAESSSEVVRLQSCDGEEVEVTLDEAKVSRTLATVLEGASWSLCLCWGRSSRLY